MGVPQTTPVARCSILCSCFPNVGIQVNRARPRSIRHDSSAERRQSQLAVNVGGAHVNESLGFVIEFRRKMSWRHRALGDVSTGTRQKCKVVRRRPVSRKSAEDGIHCKLHGGPFANFHPRRRASKSGRQAKRFARSEGRRKGDERYTYSPNRSQAPPP